MSVAPASAWQVPSLPAFFAGQLADHGHADLAAAECAQALFEVNSPVATASLLVDLADCKFLEGDVGGALATWRRVISSGLAAPASRALLNLGLVYEHLELYDHAVEVLRSAAEHGVQPHAVHAVIVSARCRMSAGDHRSAVDLLTETTAASPGAPDGLLGAALVGLGDASAALGDIAGAERSWRSAIASDDPGVRHEATTRLADPAAGAAGPSTAPMSSNADHLLLDRVEELVRGDRRAEASGLLATIEGASLVPADRFRLIDVLLEFGRVNRAIDHLELLLSSRVAEQHLRAAHTLGQIYQRHEMLTDAEAMYRKAVDSGDTYWSSKAAVGMAEVLDEMGEHGGANAYWGLAAASPIDSVRTLARARTAMRAGEARHAHDAPGDDVPSSPSAGVDEAPHAHDAPVGESASSPSAPVGESASSPSAGVDEATIDLTDDDPAEAVIELALDPPVVATATPPSPEPGPSPSPVVIPLRPEPRNPYAALAPDDLDETDLVASPRNPYAELAPSQDEPDVGGGPDPDHWRGLLDDWPAGERRGFFARHT